jgi:hypothetical protein
MGIGADCEAVRDALLAQPANTVSSLAYLVAAASLVLTRRRAGRQAHGLVAAVVFVGIGSAAFHGDGGTAARLLHDGAVALLVLTGGITVAREWRPRNLRPDAVDAVGLAALVGGVVVYLRSRTGGPWCDPDALLQGHALWHVATAVALAALGRARPSGRGPRWPGRREGRSGPAGRRP